ncbi:metal ABC transporter substrate-binding protein [Bacillota bacterium LX-D]|nr:metal ABC transporter substrate-binding protein [Bacillota bacterium LX-D]
MNTLIKRSKAAVLLVILMVSILTTGCGKENAQVSSDHPKKTIVTSFYPMYIMALNITEGVSDVEVVNLTKPITGCLHDYQLTPQDVKTLENSKIFIVNGAGMESFLDEVIKQLPNLKIIEASKNIPLIKNQDGSTNPHVWVSISNYIQEVKNIEEQLAVQDPDNQEKYQSNTEKYVQKLEALRSKMHRELKSVAGRDIITFHEAFPYFAREFGLKIGAVIEREPGSEPSAKEIAETIKLVKKKNIQALFAEPQYPDSAAQTIARETQAKVYILDPSVTGDQSADSYLRIMEENLRTLKEALVRDGNQT